MIPLYISIDFDSNEALYIQLRNQIILAIVRQDLTQGQNLPSVRDMAEQIGINMHTVNKHIPCCGRKAMYSWTIAKEPWCR